MIKELNYTGYTAVPTDDLSPDGQLTLSLNLINENGALHPIQVPRHVMRLNETEHVLFIHQVPGQSNYIIANRISSDSTLLLWLKKTDETTDSGDALDIISLPHIRNIEAIGNILALALDNGLYYIRWKDDRYIPLGERPPFVSIDFGLRQFTNAANSNDCSIPASCGPGAGGGSHGYPKRATKEELAEFTQTVYALINSTVADKITGKGFFYQPFFIRYAFKLYDGTYRWHSAPILMLPEVLPPMVYYTGDTGENAAAGSTINGKLSVSFPMMQLEYRILSDFAKELDIWSDIITGIDIFVSVPIYTYDQSKDLEVYPTISRLSYLRSLYPKRNIDDEIPDSIFRGHYAEISENAPFIDHFESLSNTTDDSYVVNIKRHSRFFANIKNVHDFYKIAELKIDAIKEMDDMQRLPINDPFLPDNSSENAKTDTSTLVTRPSLPDDYQSHCSLYPSSLYTFNSRLNMAGISIAPAPPFPIRSCMQLGNPSDERPVAYTITVWTRINGTKCHSSHQADGLNKPDIWFDPTNNFPRYIFYPDASAYKMEIYINDSQHYILDLTPHEFLNGAYFFLDDMSIANSPIPIENAQPESTSVPISVDILSKVYTSEVNNPFAFLPENINTVGSGKTLALRSATKALSQGQFGQFPLYVFTSEGVWALETGTTGVYTARQPISRDVCISIDSITQTDSAVLFASDRGIMLLSGSQAQCISDSINSEYPFKVNNLPSLGKIHDSMTAEPELDRCIPTLPFEQFLRNCRMVYDYTHQRIIIYNPTLATYAYIFSLKSNNWGMIHSDIILNVPSYPNALAIAQNPQSRICSLVDFSDSSDTPSSALLVTRPLKLDNPDIFKTIDTVIQRGNFRKGHVQSILYGSRDLQSWHLVWSSRDHTLRGFRGSPYKYYRIALIATLTPDESIRGATVQFTPRLTNRPR